jgi:hypothetical protein
MAYELFADACHDGNLEVVKKTYDKHYMFDFQDFPFQTACARKHYHVVEWLLNFNNKYNNIPQAFYRACEKGDIRLVKLLYPYTNLDIDILSNCIVGASRHDHLDVVKWLFNVYQDHYDCAFDIYYPIRQVRGPFTFVYERLIDLCSGNVREFFEYLQYQH